MKSYIVLDNIRSVHNVASIFRTVECLGVAEIILVGYTPAPVDRFGRARKDFAKVSLGAERTVSWRHFGTTKEVLGFLKEQKAHIVAVEQDKRSVNYKKVKPRFPAVFVFGNEVKGVSAVFLHAADVIAEIPMRGSKESLNVSVAAGIALAQFLDR